MVENSLLSKHKTLSLSLSQTYLHLQVMHWALVGVIGFLTGVVAFLINICDNYLFLLKYDQFEKGKTVELACL